MTALSHTVTQHFTTTLTTSIHQSLSTDLAGGLAFPDSGEVRRVATRCLQLFDLNASGSTHVQSQRFLSRAWGGLAGDVADVPLRPLVEQLSAGSICVQDLISDTSPEATSLFHWLAAFRHVGIPDVRSQYTSMFHYHKYLDSW